MKVSEDYFRGKKITVMGLGLLGRGVGDVEFLAQHGADLIVTDLKTEEELATSLERLRGFENIKFVLGEHRFEDFRNRDFVLKAAGVPLDSPYVEEARKDNVPVEMSTALFADLSSTTVVGVTGTRGKSTVTQMIYEALAAEKASGSLTSRVWLGGNVRGMSTLALLDEVEEGDIVVLELDSWQLQGFRERKISPHISIFTTFMPDHMNYYNSNLQAYFYDKSAIYEHQSDADVLIVSDVVAHYMEKFGLPVSHDQVLVFSEEDAVNLPRLRIPGGHNRLSARLAQAALEACGVAPEVAKEHLANFSGVTGRLEKIAEKNGVVFYNDTTATTPEAATVAINALRDRHGVVLIAGGSDKGLDFDSFVRAITEGVSGLVLLPGEGTERLRSELAGTRFDSVDVAESMSDAIERAVSLAQAGDAVVLSPGCASFGIFKNEFDRGDQFVSYVTEL